MTALASCAYEGTVVHKRLAPRQHGFAYRVFALCLDLDELTTIDRELRVFSHNRRNLLSLRDRDLGAEGPEPVADKARRLLARCGLSEFASRIELLCYPRLLGYVFNPLSVYFCRDANGDVGAVIYEVSNTFSERKSYVIPVLGSATSISQSCAKEMYVSPFTGASGSYGFHCIAPAESVVVGVNFREGATPVLKTHFRGDRRPLTDQSLIGLVARHPMMTLKIIGAIHVEAARLWAKGVPLVPRHTSPAYSFTNVDSRSRNSSHA
ncbi:MAG: DUF1365 domain-containing protein [Proteobacteria bacterium]|nr:DUF1365 domain-containing protein [Pseudomonadota bacterium]